MLIWSLERLGVRYVDRMCKRGRLVQQWQKKPECPLRAGGRSAVVFFQVAVAPGPALLGLAGK